MSHSRDRRETIHTQSPHLLLNLNQNIDKIININVAGRIFQIRDSLLRKFPHTLLGNLQKRQKYYIASENYYYFDNHAAAFIDILYYYQSGGAILERSRNVPQVIFNNECNYFQMNLEEYEKKKQEGITNTARNEPFINYKLQNKRDKKGRQRNATVRMLASNTLPDGVEREDYSKARQMIYLLTEVPNSSSWAKYFAYISTFLIIISCVAFILETMSNLPDWLFKMMEYLETVCVSFFMWEYLTRMWAHPDRKAFVTNGFNLIDIFSILPNFIELIVVLVLDSKSGLNADILTMLRIFRVFRILRLSKRTSALIIVSKTLKKSTKDILMTFYILIFCTIFGATLMYGRGSIGNLNLQET